MKIFIFNRRSFILKRGGYLSVFFREEHKRLAQQMSGFELWRKYAKSEAKLKQAARRGDEVALDREMKKHQKYEYAMLFKKFPKRRSKRRKKK